MYLSVDNPDEYVVVERCSNTHKMHVSWKASNFARYFMD